MKKYDSLFKKIKTLVAQENRIGVEILECLAEIEEKKAYAELRYDGLFSFCVKELGFSESQAYQRIQAMRALRETPEIKPMIQSGALSVSSVSKIQTHFKKIKKNPDLNQTHLDQLDPSHSKPLSSLVLDSKSNDSEQISSPKEKLHLFTLMQNQSTQAIEKKLASMRGEDLSRKLVIELSPELEALWNQVKNLSAHQTQSDPALILKLLTESWLSKKEVQYKAKAQVEGLKQTQNKNTNNHQGKNQDLKRNKYSDLDLSQNQSQEKTREKNSDLKLRQNQETQLPSFKSEAQNTNHQIPKKNPIQKSQSSLPKDFQRTSSWSTKLSKKVQHHPTLLSRHIPLSLRKEVWRRDQGQCQNCQSQFQLEIDHIQPFSKSFKLNSLKRIHEVHSLSNLRLLCRSCNQAKALRDDQKKFTTDTSSKSH